MMAMSRAQAGRGGHGAMAAAIAPVRLLLMHRDMLNLTDDQVSRLTSLHAENQMQMARRLADAYAAHIDLMQALTRPIRSGVPSRGRARWGRQSPSSC